jgi:type IV pilus assembly protein PilC
MEFDYVAYTKARKVVKGKLSATDEGAAANLLSYSGYQVLSLKAKSDLFSSDKLGMSLTKLNQKDIVMFSRQMALLLSSGTDVVAALELLQSQVSNPMFKKAIAAVSDDIRAGSSLSAAMRKHPKVFQVMFWRSISAGEKSGNLDVVLRQMADYIERRLLTEKKIKSALTYPVVVLIVAALVVLVLVTFVLPTFASLYSAFGASLPKITLMMLSAATWAGQYGIYVFGVLISLIGLIFLYGRTPKGKYQIDKIILRAPIIGRIVNLNELSRACRTMALLFRVGLPLPDIMALSVQSASNKIASEAIAGVQLDLLRGEGLSKPMAKRPFFLPLMVQMVAVGEETGNLDITLNTVAETYEVEADDKTTSAIEMIQPIMTVGIGVVIGLIAVSMLSAMYSIYGQV